MAFFKTAVVLSACMIFVGTTTGFADATYDKNQTANKLYKQGKYQQALKEYEEALLADPQNTRLKMNKGSALYKMGQFDQAQEAYTQALPEKDKKALADLHYNLANAMFRDGQKSMMQGGQGAQEKFKGALDNYIKALDLQPKDRDSKWNVQVTQQVLEQLKQQEQNQDKDQDQKNKDEKKIEPSEFAKKIKAQADQLVGNRQYLQASNIMNDALKKDQTVSAYSDYMKRLADVSEIR